MEAKSITSNDGKNGYIIKTDVGTLAIVMEKGKIIFTYGIITDRNHYQRIIRGLNLKFKNLKFKPIEFDQTLATFLSNIDPKKLTIASAEALELILNMVPEFEDDEQTEFEVETML